jgi:predicted nucleic acid-binding protein
VIFIDTNVAIDLRDRIRDSRSRLVAITTAPVMSAITLVELEGGVCRDKANAARRRELLDVMLEEFEVAMLTRDDIVTYGRIVAANGFDRRRILDRLIAAQVVNRGARLVTANAADFADIAGLELIAW